MDEMLRQLQQKFDTELNETVRKVVASYEIPTVSEDEIDPDKTITIFLTRAGAGKSAKSKNSKKSSGKKVEVKIAFSLELTFEIHPSMLSELWLIFKILEPELVVPISNRITYWSRALFRAVDSMLNDYGYGLQLFPFQIFFDTNNNIHIAKMPKFENLKFIEVSNPNKVLNPSDVLLKHSEMLKGIENFLKFQQQ